MPGYSRRSSGGGGGGGAPDAVFPDSVAVSERPVFGVTLPADGVTASDALGTIGLAVHEAAAASDVLTLDSGAASLTGQVRTSDSIVLEADVVVSRDFYIDRANAGSSFTAATDLLSKANTPVVNNERRAVMLFDFVNTSATSEGYGPLDVFISHNSIGTQTLDYEVHAAASDPFPASPTWTNSEAASLSGVTIKSGTVAVAAGGSTGISVPGSGSGNVFGSAVWFVFLGSSAVGADTVTFTLSSVESANNPSLFVSGSQA